MVRLLSIAAAVGIGAFTVIAQDLKDVDPSVIAKDHNTVLFVEYYSPNCVRCDDFASQWNQVTNLYKDQGAFAKLNCGAHPQYCKDNGIVRVPTIQAKLPSGEFTEFVGDLNFREVEKFVKDNQPKERNPEGKNIELRSSKELLDIRTSKEPWFVKFYAPWCGHCQHLAPTWEKMANKLKGKVNVAEVNCEANKPLCQEYKVTGLPTLSYFVHGANLKYTGERKLDNLVEYAVEMAGSPVHNVDSDDKLEKALKQSDVSVVYVRESDDKKGQLNLLEQIAPKFMETVPFYTIAGDEKTNMRFSLVKERDLPATIIVKDGTFYVYGKQDIRDVGTWIENERHALVTRVLPHNSNRVLRGEDVVVLGIFDPEDAQSESKLRVLANIYKEKMKEGNSHALKNFVFAQLNGKTYGNYVSKVYGIHSNTMPAVVVSDPKKQVYYDKHENGKKFSLNDPYDFVESILSLDKLVGVSTKPSKAFSIVDKVVMFFGDHWIVMTSILFGFFGLLFWLMIRNEPGTLTREEVLAKAKKDAEEKKLKETSVVDKKEKVVHASGSEPAEFKKSN